MELDQLKTAWQALGRQLERSDAIHLQALRDTRVMRARSSLRSLCRGQFLQILLGVASIALAGLLWMHAPHPAHVVAAGVAVHVYGIGCIITAGVVLGRIRGIDYAAPVLGIQKQLAAVREAQVCSAMVAGLPWWFLWVPILMVLLALAGVDLYAQAPAVIWIGLGVGAAGLLGMGWLYRQSRGARSTRFAAALDDSLAGRSIVDAQRALDEIARFERE